MKKFALTLTLLVATLTLLACGPNEVHHHWHQPPSKSNTGTDKEVTRNDAGPADNTQNDKGTDKDYQEPAGYNMAPSRRTEKECQYNDHCGNGFVCIGQCFSEKTSWECSHHKDCPNGKYCYWGVCTSDRAYPHTLEPKTHNCQTDEDCGLSTDHVCDNGICKQGMSKSSCTVTYIPHGDFFRIEGGKDKFAQKKYRLLIVSFNPHGFFLKITKTKFNLSSITIPNWASAFQLIDDDGYAVSLNGCGGVRASSQHFFWKFNQKSSGWWVLRNTVKYW